MEPILWEGYEHSFFEKDSEWYYAFGVTVACIALTFAVLGNIFFGLVIVLAAVCLGLLANRPPELHQFELTDKGLRIGNDTHRFDDMLAFRVADERETPTLLIDTKKFSSPNIIIPINDVAPDSIRNFLKAKEVKESELKETLAHHFIEFFGF